ncbi:MAG: hypothetical protein U1E76_22320 [Planctomycetota bacterium]
MNPRKSRGVILYEALLATTLLALSFLAVCKVGSEIGAMQREHAAQSRAEATVLRQLELLRAADFATLPARSGHAFDWNVDVDGDGKDDHTEIQVTFDNPNLANVALSVAWGGPESQRQLTRRVRMADRRGAGN